MDRKWGSEKVGSCESDQIENLNSLHPASRAMTSCIFNSTLLTDCDLSV